MLYSFYTRNFDENIYGCTCVVCSLALMVTFELDHLSVYKSKMCHMSWIVQHAKTRRVYNSGLRLIGLCIEPENHYHTTRFILRLISHVYIQHNIHVNKFIDMNCYLL